MKGSAELLKATSHPARADTPQLVPQMSPLQTLATRVGQAENGLKSHPFKSPSLQGRGDTERGEMWTSPLSFECHTLSEVGPWLRLEGFFGGGLTPTFDMGMQRERPCKSLATSSLFMYIYTELVLLIFQ